MPDGRRARRAGGAGRGAGERAAPPAVAAASRDGGARRLVTGVTLALSLGILVVGLPVVLVTFKAFEALANLERARTALVLGAPIPAA